MILSMTGYGSATATSDNYKVTVELKSLNSKYVEINIKLPRNYIKEEMNLRNLLTKSLQRGKINVLLNVEILNPEKQRLRINVPLVTSYANELEALRLNLGLEQQVDLEYLLSLPDAVRMDGGEGDPEEWELIDQAFRQATQALIRSRTEEGKALAQDMLSSNEVIAEQLVEVRKLLPQRIENIRSRVLSSLQEVKDRVQMDGNRFEQEILYYIEKLDINEEMVRLEKHIAYFRQTLAEPRSHGKKLGFISQEMGREINTIGSKANDADIQVFVVKMKEALEQIKEQVQNVV
ncbi:MAG: YicC/YloC family endoribonuclease [Bacteroidota bacterium]